MARWYEGDDVWLEVGDLTFLREPDTMNFSTAYVANSGAGVVSELTLHTIGPRFEGEWRTDDTTVSGTTCAIETPVLLEPIVTRLGTWELTGNAGDGTITPEGCRGSLGDAPFHLVAEAWDLGARSVGLHLSPDPIQRQERWLAGTGTARSLDVHWGGTFDGVIEETTLDLSLTGSSATLTWQQGDCQLAIPLTAEAR